jgi:hypothetical protein
MSEKKKVKKISLKKETIKTLKVRSDIAAGLPIRGAEEPGSSATGQGC